MSHAVVWGCVKDLWNIVDYSFFVMQGDSGGFDLWMPLTEDENNSCMWPSGTFSLTFLAPVSFPSFSLNKSKQQTAVVGPVTSHRFPDFNRTPRDWQLTLKFKVLTLPNTDSSVIPNELLFYCWTQKEKLWIMDWSFFSMQLRWMVTEAFMLQKKYNNKSRQHVKSQKSLLKPYDSFHVRIICRRLLCLFFFTSISNI